MKGNLGLILKRWRQLNAGGLLSRRLQFAGLNGRLFAAILLLLAELAVPRNGIAYEFYVSEEGSIKIFNSDGGYVRTFANSASAGVLQPSHTAFDSAGNLWVSSEGNDKVIQIAPNGAALQTLTDSIRGPEGLILDGAGNIYVANEDDGSIAIFAPNGTLSKLINNGSSTPVSPYPNYPSIYYPHGLALDAGMLYVANTSENSILRIDLNADPVTRSVFHQFTSTATPVGVAIDSAGFFYVTNFVSNEINKFTPSGTEIRRSDGSAFITTALQANGWSSNRALTIGPDNAIYIPNEYTGTINVYDSAGNYVRSFGNGVGEADLVATHYVSIRPDHTWTLNGDGAWQLFSNWKDGAPGYAGDTARFGNAISAARTITVNDAQTLGTLVFDSTNHYTLTSGAGGALSFNNGETAAHIVATGSHTIAVPATFGIAGITASVPQSTDQLTLAGPVNGDGVLTKLGAGTLFVQSALTSVSLTVANGTLLLGAANQIADATSMTLSGGRFSTGGFDESLGSLTLAADSTLDFGSGASVLSFAEWVWTDGTMTVTNWSGNSAGGGADQLRFSTELSQNMLEHIQFAEFGVASQRVFNAGETDQYFEIVPLIMSVIPEPATLAGALALLGLVGSARRRSPLVY